MRARQFVIACLFCVFASVTTASADGVADEADLQFTIGAEAYSRGEFRIALQHFLASNRLVPNRNVMFNIARAYEQLDRFPDAYRYYVDARRGAADARLEKDIGDAIVRIGPKVAVILVESTPPGATVYLDRTDLGSVGTTPAQLGLRPGSFSVVAELDGYETATIADIKVATGESRKVEIALKRILGQVTLTGPRGTQVRIDNDRGEIACVLPCALELPPGQHIAYFERPGFTVVPQTFSITAKQSVTVSASSIAVVGSLLVSADESNALIEIDGKAYGFTPAVIPNVPIGKRRVRVSLRGYQPIERDIEIRTNTQTDLRDLALTPERSVSAASRETESIEDAPASVTIISSQELEAFAYPTILESLRGVRGFATTFDSNYGSAAVRGLGQSNDFTNRLLVLSDGAVLNENILYQPFIHYDGRVDLGDVQRIEIVRGPSSVLYGTGAVSGVVNLVLKDRDEPEGVHAQISSYENGVARVRGGIVQRFGKHAGLWASVAGATSQGRREELTFDGGDGVPTAQATRNFDRFDAYTVTTKGWLGSRPENSASIQAFWTARENTVPTGNYSARYGDPRSFADDRRFLLEAKVARRLSSTVDLNLRAHLDYAYFHLDYWYDADEANPGIGTEDTYNYFETYKSWWGGAEARATIALGSKLKLTLGGEAVLHPKVEMRGGSFDVDMENFEPSLATNTPYSVFATAALLDYRPSAKLRIQAGLRFDYWSLQGNQDAAPGEEGGTSFPAFSPRLAVIAKPTDTDVVKLLAGSAFRAPSAYEFFYSDAGQTQVISTACGEELDSERVYSVELEETHRFSLDWTGLASIHGTLASDPIESIPVGDTCGAAQMVDPSTLYYRNSNVDQRVFGADLEVRREFRAGIMASAQYGFLHGRYANAPSDDPAIPDSRVLPNAPNHYAGVKVIVPIVQSALTGAFRAAYEDRRRIDITSTEKSDRAVVADAVLSGLVGRHGLRYAAGVYNLFNWQYSQPAAPYASPLIPQVGRSFMFSLTLYR